MDINGAERPVELTSGKHGATHSPVLSKQRDLAAWLQLDKDGAEADRYVISQDATPYMLSDTLYRAQIVIYDLTKHVKYTLTRHWDRSPDSLVVNPPCFA